MLTSQTDLTTTLYNSITSKVELCGKDILTPQNSIYNIIYDNINP